jgi:transposase
MATDRQRNRISAHKIRIMKRQGKSKARIASAHLILKIAYNILKTRQPYQELGPDYAQQELSKEDKMIQYLKRKGYNIMERSEQDIV